MKTTKIRIIEFLDNLKDACANIAFIMFIILIYVIFISLIVLICSII